MGRELVRRAATRGDFGRAAFAKTAFTHHTIGQDARAVTALARILPDRAPDMVFRKTPARS